MKGWRKKRLYGGVLKRFIEYYMAISTLIVISLSMENLYVFHNSGGVIDRDAMKHILGIFFLYYLRSCLSHAKPVVCFKLFVEVTRFNLLLRLLLRSF